LQLRLDFFVNRGQHALEGTRTILRVIEHSICPAGGGKCYIHENIVSRKCLGSQRARILALTHLWYYQC
jgi:hypothetical protein